MGENKAWFALAIAGPIAVAASLWAAAWASRENGRQETEQMRICLSAGGAWEPPSGYSVQRVCTRKAAAK